MSESQPAKAPAIPPKFDDLALLLESIPGVDGVQEIRREYSDPGVHGVRTDTTVLIVVSSGAAAAIGKKALDVAGNMIEKYFKGKNPPTKSAVIFDEHGKELRRVELLGVRQKGWWWKWWKRM